MTRIIFLGKIDIINKGVIQVRALSLTRSRGYCLFSQRLDRPGSIGMCLQQMVKKITDRLIHLEIVRRDSNQQGWVMRETTDGYFYIITGSDNLDELPKAEDYYMGSEHFSYDKLEELNLRMRRNMEQYTNEDLVNSYNEDVCPVFEQSPLYHALGASGIEVMDTLLAVYYGVDLEYYIHSTYIMYQFNKKIRDTGEISSSYRKLQKALGSMEQNKQDDDVLTGFIKTFKGGYKGYDYILSEIKKGIPGFNQDVDIYCSIEHNSKEHHNLPTRGALNQIIYYTLVWELLLNDIIMNY